MIEIRNLTKEFGPFRAVDDVSFDVARGEVLGFLGPNGAGKSTTMKMLTGFLHPTSGTARVCGHDVLTAQIEAKRCIGYLPEGAPLYPDMTPAGLLGFIADIRGLGAAKRPRIDEVVDRVQIGGVLHQPIDTLSKGFKRRVGLAQAILHDPQVLILDEPTDGLDPNQKHEVRSLIQEMAQEKVIVLSTHILEEVEAVCSRTIIISKGKVVVDCTPAELAARSRVHNAVRLSVPTADAGTVRTGLGSIDGVETVEDVPSHNGTAAFLVIPREKRSLVSAISQRARDEGWNLDEISVEHGRLDEVFRDLTGGAAN